MKLFRHVQMTSRPRLFRTNSFSSCTVDTRKPAEDATVVSEDQTEITAASSLHDLSRHNVQFCESSNVYYESLPVDEYKDYFDELWYSKAEINTFKNDAHIHARLWRSRQETNESLVWAENLIHAYKVCYNVNAAQEMNDLLESIKGSRPPSPYSVGLEKWAFPEMKPIRLRLRNQLYEKVYLLQAQRETSSLSTSRQQLQLRRVSRELTRTSRFFAIYLGHIVHHE